MLYEPLHNHSSLVYEAKQRPGGTVKDLLCRGYDWRDGRTVYLNSLQLAGLIYCRWIDTEMQPAKTHTHTECISAKQWVKSQQEERLDEAVGVFGEHSRGKGRMTYRRLSHEAGLQPLSDAVQVQVDADQAQLPSPLDQLVGLHHQPLQEEET